MSGDIVYNEGHKYKFILDVPEKGVTTDLLTSSRVTVIRFPINGREFKITCDPVYCLYRITWDKSGKKLPSDLDQQFTSASLAGMALASYFEKADMDKAIPDQMVNAGPNRGGPALKGTIDATGFPIKKGK